jgi:hypothetical protein
MWDERYSTDDYVYGTEPNDFLRGHAGLGCMNLSQGYGNPVPEADALHALDTATLEFAEQPIFEIHDRDAGGVS